MFTALWDVAKLLVVPAMGLLADLWSDGAMLAVSAAAGLVGLAMWASLEWNMPGSRP